MKNEGVMNEFSKLVVGFSDSLPLFKSQLKDKRGAKASYRQEVLAEEFLDSNSLSGAHDAANDVEVFQKLVEHKNMNISRANILQNFKSVHEIIRQGVEKIQFRDMQTNLQVSLIDKNKKRDGGLSMHMIKKMAKVGITLDNLRQCFNSSGPKGIRVLLEQDVGGKPRITQSQKIIDYLCVKINLILTDTQLFM